MLRSSVLPAELLMKMVKLDGLAVVMEADHFCMHWRGVKDTNASRMARALNRCRDSLRRQETVAVSGSR